MGNHLCCFRRTHYGENRRAKDKKPLSYVNRIPNLVEGNENVGYQTETSDKEDTDRDHKGKANMEMKTKETKNRKKRLEYEEHKLNESKKNPTQNTDFIYEENRIQTPPLIEYEENKKDEVEALYNYKPTDKYDEEVKDDEEVQVGEEVEFKIGDLMEVIQQEGNRYLVKHKKSTKEGYVHKLYVYRPNEGNVQQNVWYFGDIDPDKAINLLEESQERGTFLVRDSSQGGFTIYVLTSDKEQNVRKHLIQVTPHNEDEQGFHIRGSKKIFPTLEALVQACQESKLLSIKLGKPCKNPSMDDTEIPDIRFDSQEPIGIGNFSKVYKGMYDGKYIAVKKIDKHKGSKSVWKKEAEIMMNFQHKNLIQCYCYYFENDTFCIALELMDKGNLVEFLRNENEGKLVSQHHMISIASEIAVGMAYLEEENLIHRDLAARNVLLGSNNEIKITDFGLARALDENPVYEDPGCPFPIQWTAPEALEKGKFSSKSDVYSFAIVLFEIFSHGEPPYDGMVKTAVIIHVGNGNRLAKPKDAPEFIHDIMESCWQQNPEDRPSFKTLCDKFEKVLQDGDGLCDPDQQGSSIPETKSPPESAQQGFEENTESIKDANDKIERESGGKLPDLNQRTSSPTFPDVIGDNFRENDDSTSKNEKESETTLPDSDQPFYPPTQDELEDESTAESPKEEKAAQNKDNS